MMGLATIMALARGLHLAATLSLLGTVGFLLWMLPAAPAALHRRLIRLWWISGVIALLAGLAWFALQSAAIAGAATLSDLRDALPVVALHTRYGNTMLVRLGLVLAATLLAVPSGRWTAWVRYLTLGLAAVALLADARRHQRLGDLDAAARRAFDGVALQLAVGGGAVLEPGFETVLPIAIEFVENHDPGRFKAVA